MAAAITWEHGRLEWCDRNTQVGLPKEKKWVTGHGWDMSEEVGKVEAVPVVTITICNMTGRADK